MRCPYMYMYMHYMQLAGRDGNCGISFNGCRRLLDFNIMLGEFRWYRQVPFFLIFGNIAT